jgi:hypothetical protein
MMTKCSLKTMTMTMPSMPSFRSKRVNERSFVRLRLRSFVCFFVHSFFCSFVCSFTRLFVCSFTRLFVCSFTRSFLCVVTCSFVPSCRCSNDSPSVSTPRSIAIVTTITTTSTMVVFAKKHAKACKRAQ